MCLTKIRLNKAFSLGGRVVGMVVNYSGTSLYHRKVSFAHRPRGTSKNGDFDCWTCYPDFFGSRVKLICNQALKMQIFPTKCFETCWLIGIFYKKSSNFMRLFSYQHSVWLRFHNIFAWIPFFFYLHSRPSFRLPTATSKFKMAADSETGDLVKEVMVRGFQLVLSGIYAFFYWRERFWARCWFCLVDMRSEYKKKTEFSKNTFVYLPLKSLCSDQINISLIYPVKVMRKM